ncbi:hypothetical protein BDA96_02G012900, partial [Sorghum bicolor]
TWCCGGYQGEGRGRARGQGCSGQGTRSVLTSVGGGWIRPGAVSVLLLAVAMAVHAAIQGGEAGGGIAIPNSHSACHSLLVLRVYLARRRQPAHTSHDGDPHHGGGRPWQEQALTSWCSKKGTSTVERLTEETLRDYDHLRDLLVVCEAQRQIGETALNETSCRSKYSD